MRMLVRLEVKGGWSHTAKDIPGTQKTKATVGGVPPFSLVSLSKSHE